MPSDRKRLGRDAVAHASALYILGIARISNHNSCTPGSQSQTNHNFCNWASLGVPNAFASDSKCFSVGFKAGLKVGATMVHVVLSTFARCFCCRTREPTWRLLALLAGRFLVRTLSQNDLAPNCRPVLDSIGWVSKLNQRSCTRREKDFFFRKIF